ncbi:type I-E CRISPR-associated protein Cas7/Cse4/CasC [Actinoplanes sp. NPDC005259]|uniref:type I-E CRISPR-associated protein Cas7/Cse4/CasC n=1 Tax=Actinoplanes sp. NPDC005259 TaxID=3154674 RepID=UPI0033A08058
MSPRTYVDVHILQTVPPSNLNRDDAGTPKQAVYGGVRRARVSSQAWKRATRTAFADQLHLPAHERGVRTKRISALLADRLGVRTGLDTAQSARLSTYLLKDLGITPAKPRTSKAKSTKPADDTSTTQTAAETSYLLFFGNQQIDTIVDLVAADATTLAALTDDALQAAVDRLPVREQLQKGHPIDVALFGRMVADLSMLNVDAAAQVAHALSTHAVDVEFDYFTAVDDAKSRDEDAGAAMIGTVEFTSATLYRYATVGVKSNPASIRYATKECRRS